MGKIKLFVGIFLLCVGNVFAGQHWKTHFAYNSVQLIAMDEKEVYALANGKLFSINQQTEDITIFTNFSGLHGTDVAHIAYDKDRKQLLILYSDGKMDILHDENMRYIPDLYNKQMTSSKRCNNITIQDNIAYLAMDFGILTFDLDSSEFVDTYYIGPEAKDLRVLDVMLYGDSIYAQTTEVNYSAYIEDNIVDFRCWNECTKLPQPFDPKKGKECIDENGGVWKVAGNKGVLRDFMTGEQAYYLPAGPCVNNPYRIEVANGRLYMLPGGRWASQEKKPGNVMIYEDGRWTNITNEYIEQQTGKQALDFMDVAVDPQEPSHFFVTSYGTGLYEFKDSLLIGHHTPENSILGSAVPDVPERYTRLESAVYDKDNCLWTVVNGEVDSTFVCFLPNGSQRGVNLYLDPTTRVILHTSGSMIIDTEHPEKKWLVSCRSIPAVVQLDDGGTPFDSQDDKCKVQSEFYDQDGNVIVPDLFYSIAQAPNGDIWIGSSSGPIIIPSTIDFLQSNQCSRLRINMPDGSNLLDTERINAFAWDADSRIWIGTQTGGIYILDSEYTNILEHYTVDNSVMPSNSILSLAYDSLHNKMFIGTGMGLVSYQLDSYVSSYIDENLNLEDDITYGNMYRWRSHAAFTEIEEVVVMGDKAYGLSSNSLFSVSKTDGEIEYYTRLNGLSSSVIDHIEYNESLDRMLITYRNGQIDIMESNGTIYNIPDLFLKQMSVSKQVNDICMYQDKAVLAMNFGLLIVDMKKAEFSDTYYIGENSSELKIDYITIAEEHIYAATDQWIYYARLTDNLMDYANWKTLSYPIGKINGMRAYRDIVHLLVNQRLYVLLEDNWCPSPTINHPPFRGLCVTKNGIYALPYRISGVWRIFADFTVGTHFTYGHNYTMRQDGDTYWLGSRENGLIHLRKVDAPEYQTDIQEYHPDGPLNNYAYQLTFANDKLYMLPGGRWASQYGRAGDIMIYENGEWTNIKNKDLVKAANGHALRDFINVAQDPLDSKHYFVTTYGTGLLEMRDTSVVNLYLPSNSGLSSAIEHNPDNYTRTDGILYDDKGYLWVLNTGEGVGNVHVVSPDGKWHSFDVYANNKRIILHTAGKILLDQRNPQWKWIPVLRSEAGLVLLQDNGTPTDFKDDRIIHRHSWIDQNSNPINPMDIRAIAQDKNNTIWLGTSSGIFAIPYYVDFTTSNQCIRVVIPRNDGSGLGDYMLDNEQVNSIVIDGANRMWVGTANSGVFLLNPVGDIENIGSFTMETVAHFTTENSILPTNEVISIAIQESTGEVFIGTGGGLVSYMSDAVAPMETFDNLYAYPNPVYPTYQGYITIRGMMEDSEVRIIDASGNLVKTLQGNGGSAVWDGTNVHGDRVASGIYTAVCNTKLGNGHGVAKILILN